jgi:acetyltransferase-like isoleucine patch superfamily enzyme
MAFKILRKISRFCFRNWYLYRFLWLEKGRHRQVVVGKLIRFNVPVRGGGEGTLIIGNRNSFGFCLAPRQGTGEILLQARHPDAKIVIGEANVFNNNFSMIANDQITIGNGCQIGELVTIYDCDFHEIDPLTRNHSAGLTKPVIIAITYGWAAASWFSKA